jgi:hypothetical protein
MLQTAYIIALKNGSLGSYQGIHDLKAYMQQTQKAPL